MNLESSWPISQGPATGISVQSPAVRTRKPWIASSYIQLVAYVLDYLSICSGTAAGLMTYNLFGGARVSNEVVKLIAFSAEYAIAFILLGRILYIYTYSHKLLRIRDTAGILRVSTFCLLLISVELFFSKMVIPRGLVGLSWLFITLFVLLEKHSVHFVFSRWKAGNSHERKALIVGAGQEARRIFSFLLNSPDLQMRPVAFLEERSSDDLRVLYSHDYRFKDHATVLNGPLHRDLLQSLAITDVFVADPTLSSEKLSELASLSAEHSVNLSFVASSQPPMFANPISYRVMDGLFVSSFSCDDDSRLAYQISKRILDIVVSIVAILVSLPIWIIAAICVKLTSEGPIFFRQVRIGKNGKPFTMLKFRSMYSTSSKYARSPIATHDSRITPAGRFLRRSSIDELPQLLNVLMGQMSLVGPRPEMPYIVDQYTLQQKRRLSVKQGLTGMWQLSADRKYAIHESLEYDLYYLENKGFFLDVAILLHTFFFAMSGI